MRRPAGQHPAACICTVCLFAELDAAEVAAGLEPIDDDPFVRVPRAYRDAMRGGGVVGVVLPAELEDASTAELVEAGAVDAVLVHVEDVSAGMYLRVTGLDQDGAEVTVTGFIGWPYDDGPGVVAVPVADEAGDPPRVVVLVEADARLELRPEPWDQACRAARVVDLGELDRVELLRSFDGPWVAASFPVGSVDQVDAIARSHHADPLYPAEVLTPVLYTRNWRGQP